jgi:hypothetical protein
MNYKFKNIDVLIGKRLTTIIPVNQTIYRDRVHDSDGVEVTLPILIKIIKAVIKNNKIIEDSRLPEQLMTSLTDFMIKSEDSITLRDVENLFSIFKYYEYTFDIIGRIDLGDAEVTMPEADQTAYVVDNFKFNETGSSGFYAGYGINYDFESKPLVMDFFNFFSLTPEEYEKYELSTSKETYDLFKSEGQLDNFDDSLPIEYIRARGMKFSIYRNI